MFVIYNARLIASELFVQHCSTYVVRTLQCLGFCTNLFVQYWQYVCTSLYIKMFRWTYENKCFTVYKVQCSEGYDTGKVILRILLEPYIFISYLKFVKKKA